VWMRASSCMELKFETPMARVIYEQNQAKRYKSINDNHSQRVQVKSKHRLLN
jgi:hypothetical protein